MGVAPRIPGGGGGHFKSLIPVMTANSQNGYIVSASNKLDGEPYYAFDGNCKIKNWAETNGGTQYVFDTVTRLLNNYRKSGGVIPCYDKAYMAIVEHCPMDRSGTFDNDNKGFRGAVNALKGRLFRDDNQFELALGLFTVRLLL